MGEGEEGRVEKGQRVSTCVEEEGVGGEKEVEEVKEGSSMRLERLKKKRGGE